MAYSILESDSKMLYIIAHNSISHSHSAELCHLAESVEIAGE